MDREELAKLNYPCLWKNFKQAFVEMNENRIRQGLYKQSFAEFLDFFGSGDKITELEKKIKERTKRMINRDFIYTGQDFCELTQALQEAEPPYTRLFVERPYLNYFETKCCANKRVDLGIGNKNVFEFCGVPVTNCAIERSKERIEIQLSEVLQELADGGYIYCQENGEPEVTFSFQNTCEIKITEMQIRGGKWFKWVR